MEKTLFVYMKNLIIKSGFSYFLATVLGMATVQAQNVGGTGSNQSAPKEVKAAELSKGAYTSDVNLFTGTMATSYDLGTVSTFSGLSYKLQLNYSTTKTTGHNPGLVRGLSYGDGWNVNIPTISVTVEAFRNLYLAVDDGTADHCKLLTNRDASKEGNLVWFAPYISIPGVVNERFILKTIDTLHNEMVFVPNQMEKYVEARLRIGGSTWKVINNNGDVYDFKTVMTNYRAPSQLNYVEDSMRTLSGVSKNNVLPKEEPVTWFCNYIYNKNQPLDQQIMFDYEGFGSFNFYKEFDQTTLNQSLGMKVGNTVGMSPFAVPYRDILLKGIESYSARGSIERIELNYKTILPPTSASKDMLLLTESSVRRHDSLYNYRIVYSDGVDNDEDSLQLHSNAYHDEYTTPLSFNYGLNDPHQTFNTAWRRYLHVMHDDASAIRYPLYSSSDNFKRPDNPYVFKKATDGATGEYYYQKNISSSTPNSEIAFDDGFLESPKITHDIIPGDLYEVKSYIKNYNITDEHLQICNFDINVVSGSGSENGNGTNQVDEGDFISGTRGLNVFNTFNNPVKWTSAAHNIVGSSLPPHTVNGFIVTSNMFLMPGLPRSFSGINVQIGPANSDNDFSIDLQHDLSRYFFHTGPLAPNSYYTYKYPQQRANGGYGSSCLKSPYTKPSQNFGIGLPWYMMKDVYSDLTNDADTNYNNEHYQFWWKDINKLYGGSGVSTYSNVPTAADANVRLAAFELVRYSKNPYMLYSVKKYKTNGYVHIQHPELNTEVLVSQLDLKYSFKLDSIYSYVYTNQSIHVLNDTAVGCTNYSGGHDYLIKKLLQKDFLGYQNIYLLDEIKQVPTNGSMANASSSYVYADLPATHFYYTEMNSDSLVGRGTSFNFAGNIYLVNKIVDQLGGTMKYEYYPLNDVYHTHFVGTYVDNNPSPIPSGNPYHVPEPYSYKVQIAVKSKQYFNSASAALPVKTWLYDYSEGSSFPGPCNDGAALLLADRKVWGTGDNFVHNSMDIDFGFLTTIVKYPQLNSSTAVPYDKYTHYYQENRHLIYGKLKQVEKFDAAGQLITKKTYDYKATMAFGNFMFTGNKAVSSVFNEIGPEYTSEYEEAYPYGFSSSYRRYFFGKCNMSMSEPDIPFLEMNDPSLFQGSTNKRHPNCYFVRLVKETTTDYDYAPVRNANTTFVADPSFRGVKLSDSGVDRENAQAFSGINSLKLEASLLTSSNPALATSNLIPLMRRNEMTSITEYDYWDADSIGITTCDGFEQLLNPDATPRPEILLNYEPSFELFRTKTYSPQLSGAYNTSENYYYYDLKQDVNKLGRVTGNSYDEPSNFDGLYYSHRYGIRNLMYQKRVTSKAVNQPAIARSEYYWYDCKTKTDTEFFADTLYIEGLIESCPEPYVPDTIPSDSITPGPGVYNDLGCYRAPIHDFTPPLGWGLTLIDGEWWFCPGATQQTLGPDERDVAARPYIYPSDLNTKLLLRRIDEQVDTVRPNLTFYNKYEPIMRFYELFEESSPGGTLVPQNDYNWFAGYKTKIKYRTLEHTPMGFVRLDMNERGLKTRYAYDTVFSVTVMDPLLGCFSGGAWDDRNQGVPRCITVGAFRADSLTTCYVYNKDYTVDSIIDPNSMVLSYYYDNFSRLRMALRNGDTLSVNAYSQWANDTTLDFEDRADGNFVESWILLNKGSKMAEHSRAYVDPLGRKYDVQTQISDDYTNLAAYDSLMVHSGTTTYDNWDRVSRQYKPFKYVNSGSPVPFAPRFSGIGAKYTEQQYEGNQRGRVLRAAKFGESINVGHTVNSSYVIINGNQLRTDLGNVSAIWQAVTGETSTTPLQSQSYLKTAAIDEDGKKTITYTNALGQKVAVKTYSDLSHQEVTAFIYDSQGNLKRVINPKQQNTTYEYNLSGNLFRKVSVDADTVKYLYDVSGNVVLEQDANGKHGRNETDAKPYMRKYTYDAFGRMTQQDRVYYSQYHDPLHYAPFIYGWFSGIADTTKAFYQFTNTATLDFYGGWIIEKCQVSLPIFRTVPPGQGGGTYDPYPGFDPGTDPTDPPTNLCPMVYANVYDSLTLSAHEKDWAYHAAVDLGDADLGAIALTYLPGQNHLKGRLSMAKSYTHAGAFSNLNIYSYNTTGLMERELTQYNHAAGPFTSVIDYLQYNLRNSLIAQEVDADADGTTDMRYTYKYDGWNRLRYASAKQGTGSSQKLAEYTYDDALGLVTNTKYFNATAGCDAAIDSIAYTYDVRNRLTKLDARLYTEKLYYDLDKPQTYQAAFKPAATKNFNGNINGLIHTYKLNSTSNYALTGGMMDSSTVYGYTYDGLNRLTKADASVLNVLDIGGAYAPRLKYGDESMSYDAIGNMSSLNRGLYYNPSITTPAYAEQNWVYNYGAGTNNHLIRIDSVNALPLRKYGYDQNGNGTVQIIEAAKNSTDYMRSNLPSHIAITPDTTGVYNVVNAYYDYNNNNDRVYKGVYNDHGSQQYYYLRDNSGKEIAEYNITNNTWTHYAYGRERIAEYTASSIKYYNYDHLGSTRTVYSVDTDCEDPVYTIENANDFYPFGRTLRAFNGDNKYAYQGSQKEPELGDADYYTHFRTLDAEVNRWWQVDPKVNASISAYASMDNNPVMMTDPLGDCPMCPPGVRANGAGYGALGVIAGLAQSVGGAIEGAYNAVRHLDKTLVTAAKIASNDPVTRVQMGAAVYKMGAEIKSTIKYGDSFDKGYLSGQVIGNTALLFVGGGEANAGTKALAVAGKEAQVIKTLEKISEAVEMTKVGRWMSKTEYEIMAKTGKMVEGAGGQTFVATGGPNSFNAAAKGSVYAEFEVPTNSLIKGGGPNGDWYKVIGPNANKSMQDALKKAGGTYLPDPQNLTPILLTK